MRNRFPTGGSPESPELSSVHLPVDPEKRISSRTLVQEHDASLFYQSRIPLLVRNLLRSGCAHSEKTVLLEGDLITSDPDRQDTPLEDRVVITVCAHCKRVISETAFRDNKVSHGICNKCLASLEKEIQQSPRPSSEPRASKDVHNRVKDQA